MRFTEKNPSLFPEKVPGVTAAPGWLGGPRVPRRLRVRGEGVSTCRTRRGREGGRSGPPPIATEHASTCVSVKKRPWDTEHEERGGPALRPHSVAACRTQAPESGSLGGGLGPSGRRRLGKLAVGTGPGSSHDHGEEPSDCSGMDGKRSDLSSPFNSFGPNKETVLGRFLKSRSGAGNSSAHTPAAKLSIVFKCSSVQTFGSTLPRAVESTFRMKMATTCRGGGKADAARRSDHEAAWEGAWRLFK